MKNPKLEIKENIPLGGLTTFGVGGPARYFAVAETEDDIVQALEFAKGRGLPFFVLGGGSNVLISDEGFPGIVIHNRISGFDSSIDGKSVAVRSGAGEDWQDFVDRCVGNGWQGVECLAGIPGTVGAAPVQNIGAYGQDVSQVVTEVRVIETDTGKTMVLLNEECGFGYRLSVFNSASAGRYIITGVTFRLRLQGITKILYPELAKYFAGESAVYPAQVRDAVMAIRNSKGLLVRAGYESFKSGGSFFKNPVVPLDVFKEVKARIDKAGGCVNWAWPAGPDGMKLSAACLIQCAGFTRGHRRGDAGISPRHCLIIVNYGSSSARAILDIACEVQQKVLRDFGTLLVTEVRLVGFSSSCLQTYCG